MDGMIVFTAKKDGGTQNVHGKGFYEDTPKGLEQAFADAKEFLYSAIKSKRAIVRIELYNPSGEDI